jgi:hypothetical protein
MNKNNIVIHRKIPNFNGDNSNSTSNSELIIRAETYLEGCT